MKWNEKSGSTCAAINQTHIQSSRFFGPIDRPEYKPAPRIPDSKTIPSSVCNRSDEKEIALGKKRMDSNVLEYFSSAKWLRKIFRFTNAFLWPAPSSCFSFGLELSNTPQYHSVTVPHTYTNIIQSHVTHRTSRTISICGRQWAPMSGVGNTRQLKKLCYCLVGCGAFTIYWSCCAAVFFHIVPTYWNVLSDFFRHPTCSHFPTLSLKISLCPCVNY